MLNSKHGIMAHGTWQTWHKTGVGTSAQAGFPCSFQPLQSCSLKKTMKLSNITNIKGFNTAKVNLNKLSETSRKSLLRSKQQFASTNKTKNRVFKEHSKTFISDYLQLGINSLINLIKCHYHLLHLRIIFIVVAN